MVAALAVTLLAGNARAGAPENSWYVAPQVNALWLDDGRQADDDIGFTLGLGRTMSPNWDAEIALFGSQHDRAGNNNSVELQGFAFKANRVFYREGRVNPFISLGLGRVKSISKPGGDDSDLTALGGIGLLVELGGSKDDGSAMQLRADLGARRGLSSNSTINHAVDYVAGLGFQYNWGGTPPRRVVDSDGDGVNDDADKCPGTPAGTAVDTDGCPLPQDDDHDGVNNDVDKCPGTPAGAKVDANGCELDTDGDGVSDSRDQCPNTPAGANVDANGCPMDSDRDSVPDGIDKCPNTPAGTEVDTAGCQRASDADSDGVDDTKDKCPGTAAGTRVDAAGCPILFTEEKTPVVLRGVTFETGRSALRPDSYTILDMVAASLVANPDINIEIAGHTDSTGSRATNLRLSQARANAVRAYLARKGVAPNRMVARGYGPDQPVAPNNTPEGRAQNRRVEIFLNEPEHSAG